jgi:hypothetical protein
MGAKMIGKFTVEYNGEVIAEGENLIDDTPGPLFQIEFDEPIQCNLDSPPMNFEYVFTLEDKMKNEKNRKHLKDLMDLLSDKHAELTERAACANKWIVKADEREEGQAIPMRMAASQLTLLLQDLDQHALRVLRVREEIEQVRENLKI